jgi:hypothetical protein
MVLPETQQTNTEIQTKPNNTQHQQGANIPIIQAKP